MSIRYPFFSLKKKEVIQVLLGSLLVALTHHLIYPVVIILYTPFVWALFPPIWTVWPDDLIATKSGQLVLAYELASIQIQRMLVLFPMNLKEAIVVIAHFCVYTCLITAIIHSRRKKKSTLLENDNNTYTSLWWKIPARYYLLFLLILMLHALHIIILVIFPDLPLSPDTRLYSLWAAAFTLCLIIKFRLV